MSIEGTSRTISVAAVASAGIHALLYLGLSTYGQRVAEPRGTSAEVQLVLAPSELERANTIESSKPPEPATVEEAALEKPPLPPPPAPPPPPKEEVERVRLGNQSSPETETKTWLGSDKPEESQARKASVEQGAFTQSPGLPGNPSESMGPESASPTAAPTPSADSADPSTPTDSPEATDASLSSPASAAVPVPQLPASPEEQPKVNAGATESASTESTSEATMKADNSATVDGSRNAAPSPASAPTEADGLRAPERSAPESPRGKDLTKLLDVDDRSEINLDDLFPPAALTPNSERAPKQPMTRERAIAMMREALSFPLLPRPAVAAPAAPPPTNPQPSGGGGGGDRPFEKADRDVDPSSLDEPIEVRPGRPLAAKGLEIKTVPLDLTTLSRRFTWTTNPVVRVKFGRQGKVLHADFVKGQTAGSPEWNNAILSAMYRWTAAGEELKGLSKQDPEAGVEVQFRILLRD